MGDGGRTGVKPAPKENPGKRLARINREKRAAEAAEIARLRAENDSMKERLGIHAAPPATGDPLAWITRDTPFVELVSSTSLFVLRPERKSMMPHLLRVTLKAHSSQAWHACPFYVGDRNDHQRDTNLKVFKESWWHLRLTKDNAESVYADERWPRPKEAVIEAGKFHRWDSDDRRAVGERQQIPEFVALREVTRYLLQKSSQTYLNWLLRPKGYEFDRRVPNPYRNRLIDIPQSFVEGARP